MFYQFPPGVTGNVTVLELGHCTSKWRETRKPGDVSRFAKEFYTGKSDDTVTILTIDGNLFAVVAGKNGNGHRWVCDKI